MTLAALQELPPCNFRTEISDEAYYICGHNRVRAQDGVVTADVCMHCSVRLLSVIPEESQPQASSATAQLRKASFASRAWNLTLAVKDFLADGCRMLSPEEFRARLEICDSCEHRSGNSCTKCGCHLSLKARGRALYCPVGKWPTIGKRRTGLKNLGNEVGVRDS